MISIRRVYKGCCTGSAIGFRGFTDRIFVRVHQDLGAVLRLYCNALRLAVEGGGLQ